MLYLKLVIDARRQHLAILKPSPHERLILLEAIQRLTLDIQLTVLLGHEQFLVQLI